MRYVITLLLLLSTAAGQIVRLESVHEAGLEVRLRISNEGSQDLIMSPVFMIEEFYEKPACDDCAKGWIATRPRSTGASIQVKAGGSSEFSSPRSPRPTRITVFWSESQGPREKTHSLSIELPGRLLRNAGPEQRSHARAETSKSTKREKIMSNLRLIAAAGEQCTLRTGMSGVDMVVIRREFPEEIAKVSPIDGEDYSRLVYSHGSVLKVQTQSMGDIALETK